MDKIRITDTIDLHTFLPAEIEEIVQEYLYQCHKKKFRVARIIHGKGIGVQRETVRAILAQSPYVDSYTDGPDWGSTTVFFRSGSRPEACGP